MTISHGQVGGFVDAELVSFCFAVSHVDAFVVVNGADSDFRPFVAIANA